MNVYSLSLVGGKTLATLLVASFLFASFGFTMWTTHTQAAGLTTASDTLSDSDLGVLADHTIVFTSPTGIVSGETVTITFSADWNLSTSTVDFEDIDVASTSDAVLAAACAGGIDIGAAIAGQVLTLEFCTDTSNFLSAGGTTTIEMGLNATFGIAGASQVTNPGNAGSYAINIAGTQTDSAQLQVAIIDDVVVTASVDTRFTFEITGMPAGYLVNGSIIPTVDASTPTTLPFGTLVVDTESTLAQNLRVTTNATNGFTVTLNQDQNLTSSGGDDIDRFIDDSGVASPAVWAAPLGNIGNENEYGHMGITSEDSTFVGATNPFGVDLWAGNFVNNAREVFYHDGPADGITTDTGSTTVGFQVEISAFQEAGTDYTATITYVATPVF